MDKDRQFKIILPSHLVPDDEVVVGDITIRPGVRSDHKTPTGSKFINTAEVSYTNKRHFEDWLRFHSFITRSRVPIEYYTREGITESLEKVSTSSFMPADFSSIASRIYLDKWQVDKLQKGSYCEMYSIYMTLSGKKKDLVSSFLIDLSNHSARHDRLLLDSTYWQIANINAIVERIIDEQSFCEHKTSCEKCSKNSIQHYALSSDEWLKKRIRVIMENSEWYDTYYDIIRTVQKTIRRKPVHMAELPKAIYPTHLANEVVRYTHNKVMTQHDQDAHALKAFLGMFESVAWHLLMNHIFHHGIFERPTGYSVQYITGNINK